MSEECEKEHMKHVEALQAKKGQILDFVKRGLDQEQAIILTGTSVEMQKELSEDEDFMTCLNLAKTEREFKLIEDMEEIIRINKPKGLSLEIRYLLEHQYPERWAVKTGGRSFDNTSPDIPEENRGL